MLDEEGRGDVSADLLGKLKADVKVTTQIRKNGGTTFRIFMVALLVGFLLPIGRRIAKWGNTGLESNLEIALSGRLNEHAAQPILLPGPKILLKPRVT